jgi:hypothetical protein
MPKRTDSRTSPRVASIASKGLKAPSTLTTKEIKTIAASVLEQREREIQKKKR